jgi:hypothetical protein
VGLNRSNHTGWKQPPGKWVSHEKMNLIWHRRFSFRSQST